MLHSGVDGHTLATLQQWEIKEELNINVPLKGTHLRDACVLEGVHAPRTHRVTYLNNSSRKWSTLWCHAASLKHITAQFYTYGAQRCNVCCYGTRVG